MSAEQVRSWLGQLFEKLCQKPELMPGYFRRLVPEHGLERTICDYIAGMTDRFCIKYQLFDLEATRRENTYLRKLLEEDSG
ncbi:MAG: hypothetical protein KAY65_12680 [Planctomycetes bacterium]|nr:hypothetical protein [Planctomycetota bacterium]